MCDDADDDGVQNLEVFLLHRRHRSKRFSTASEGKSTETAVAVGSSGNNNNNSRSDNDVMREAEEKAKYITSFVADTTMTIGSLRSQLSIKAGIDDRLTFTRMREKRSGNFLGEAFIDSETLEDELIRMPTGFSGCIVLTIGRKGGEEEHHHHTRVKKPEDSIVDIYLWEELSKLDYLGEMVLPQSLFTKNDDTHTHDGNGGHEQEPSAARRSVAPSPIFILKQKLASCSHLLSGTTMEKTTGAEFKICRVPAWQTSGIEGVASVRRDSWDNSEIFPIKSGDALVLCPSITLERFFEAQRQAAREQGIEIKL